MRRSSLAPYALLAALAGCGQVATLQDAAPDAFIADADTTPDAAVAGVVKVTVLDPNNGTPAVNVPVVFQNADGTVVLDGHSSGTGTAMATMLAGGSVSAVIPDGASAFQVLTVLGVVPGDDITLGNAARDQSNIGTFTITNIPVIYSGYTAYVYGPCGSVNIPANTTSVVLTLRNDCKDNTTDLLLVQTSGTTTYSLLKPNVMFRGNTTESVQGFDWNYDSAFTASVLGLPLDIDNANISRRTAPDYGYSDSSPFTVGQATGAVTLQAPQATTAYMNFSMGRGNSQVLQLEKIAGQSHTYGVDATTMLPWISGVTGDLGANTIAWTEATAGTGDIMALGFNFKRATVQYNWIVFGPPSLSGLTLPTLPADAGGVNPVMTDTLNQIFVYRLDQASTTGYDALRQDPFRAFNGAFGGQTETKLRLSLGAAGGLN